MIYHNPKRREFSETELWAAQLSCLNPSLLEINQHILNVLSISVTLDED